MAYLTTILADYLQINLFYPIAFGASKSWISDPLSSEKFPLFPQAQEQPQFEYGVFLLNRNIEQVFYVANV